MSDRRRPRYTDKNSTQTLREGLEEYYIVNSDFSHPSTQPPDFAKILFAHDASHVIYGCDTDMYDELKILPLTFWTSDFKFRDYLRERKNPAVDVMYEDLIKRHGVLWLVSSILIVVPQVLPELISIWFKTRKRQRYVPFLNFEPLLDRSLLEIRTEFEILPFIK
ncbi:MAG TPA: hypothetical protein DDW76_19770 [Cyanobacteria bacterium UBA11369]|nr:hypothetical protein [Cyanobacteria bacterium UBA8553]HAZ44219.1 hypothetical protein [Cyanobacteria bacterium UBA11371]HBE33276.1 hypothetical protein [Cyanobacteria bacterium UBA11368]HBE50947.1 hypothetical protein [Cyanobacteria bacterium UBA11369]